MISATVLANNPDRPSSGSTSLSMLEGIKASDPEAWRRLVQLYGPLLYHWCRQRRLPEPDAQDLVQEVLLGVAKGIRDFRRERADDSFRGWLWTITHNKVGDWLRKQRQQRGRTETTPIDIDAVAAPPMADSSLGGEEIAGLYRRAIDLIREEFETASWQAFWAVVIEGRSAA